MDHSGGVLFVDFSFVRYFLMVGGVSGGLGVVFLEFLGNFLQINLSFPGFVGDGILASNS